MSDDLLKLEKIFDKRSRYVKQALTIILAGGRGTRLKDLTLNHSKPAVWFGGKFRIIDFTLSNCINSGLRKIAVLTQYKSHSLIKHIQRGWSFLRPEANEFIDLMPAQQQLDKPIWYQGTSDAVYQNIEFIEQNSPKYVVILAGDHIYKMDYSIMLSYHIRKNAKCTVGCIEIPKEEAYRFGIMKIDKDSNIIDFVEKPKENPPIIPGNSTKCLGSMGIYIFDKDYLVKKLKKDAKASKSNHDFGKNIIPEIVKEKSAVAHFFQDSCIKSNKEAKDYWRDVGTVYTYWQSNIELTDVIPEFDMYDNNWPILTYQSQLPPAKFIFNYDGRRGQALDSVVADGCIISGATLVKSIAFTNVRINSHAYIENSVLLPNVEVGQNAKLNKVIVDQDVKIPADLVVGEDPKFDEENFYRTPEGVVLITKDMINRL